MTSVNKRKRVLAICTVLIAAVACAALIITAAAADKDQVPTGGSSKQAGLIGDKSDLVSGRDDGSPSIDNGGNNKDEQDIKSLVEAFGSKLKNVSLLASEDVVAADIKEHYGDYVTSGLMQKWLADPQSAPGREVSSPWPERIDIVGLEMSDEGQYTIYGEIIDVTAVELENGGIAARRPIVAEVIKENGKWFINNITVGAYSPIFETVLNVTPKEEYVALDFSFRNISGKPLEIYFGSGQKYDIIVTDSDGKEVYRWSHDKIFTLALESTQLEKDGEMAFSEVWDYKDNDGNRVPAGKYTVTVQILAINEDAAVIGSDELTASEVIEVK